MPIYEYQCSICKKIEEELNSSIQTQHSIGCLTCLQPMNRIISAPQGKVSGSTAPSRIRQAKRIEVVDNQDFGDEVECKVDDAGNVVVVNNEVVSKDDKDL